MAHLLLTPEDMPMAVVTDELLAILCCPVEGGPLTEAGADVVANINEAIAHGTAQSLGGNRLEKRIQGGLMNSSGSRLYPIVDGIPVMLPDEAIDPAAAAV